MNWYHSSDHIELNSPSRADGVDFETEARYRKEGARFVMELGNKLGLPFPTIATGWVFFHRFYLFHSFKEFPRWVTGATCLLLGGKVEETPKKCKNILKYAQQVLDDNKFKTFGDNPREELMVCERVLLQTIKFDLQISHPYQFLIKYGKLLKGDKSRINDLIQAAWTLINESFLTTTLCLVYKPQVIAIAVLLLAIKETKQSIQDFISSRKHHEWWKLFYSETNEGELEQVCKDLTSMVIEGKNPKRHGQKKLDNAATNSPQPLGSPKQKKMKIPSDLALDHTKLNGSMKEEQDSDKKPESVDHRGRRISSRDTYKQDSQTPEEMDVEKPSPDLIGDILEPKGHHDKKDHHQPVTLQQVQAAANKQLQKQVQKQRMLLHRNKHHTPNSKSSVQKMPSLTPLQGELPKLKSIANIKKQLDALSQEAAKVQQKTMAIAETKKAHAQATIQNQKQKTKVPDSDPAQHVDSSSAQKPHEHPPPVLHAQLSQPNTVPEPPPPAFAMHQQQPMHQQTMNVQHQAPNMAVHSPVSAVVGMEHSVHSTSTPPPNLAEPSAAPLLDHMSSFFQSSQPSLPAAPQAYNERPPAYNNYPPQPQQSYNNYQPQQPPPPSQSQPHTTVGYAPQPQPLFPPQPPLPQGIPQPPPQQPQPPYSGQQNFMNNVQQQQQQQQYQDNSAHTYNNNYTTTQPQLILPPPPAMFHSNHGQQQSW